MGNVSDTWERFKQVEPLESLTTWFLIFGKTKQN